MLTLILTLSLTLALTLLPHPQICTSADLLFTIVRFTIPQVQCAAMRHSARVRLSGNSGPSEYWNKSSTILYMIPQRSDVGRYFEEEKEEEELLRPAIANYSLGQ